MLGDELAYRLRQAKTNSIRTSISVSLQKEAHAVSLKEIRLALNPNVTHSLINILSLLGFNMLIA